MALMNPAALTADEQRKNDLDAAFSGTKAKVVGFKPVRRVTALVVDLLRRSNNFFITGAQGFKAIGIDPKKLGSIIAPTIDGEPNPDFDPSKAGAMVPRIAEVIALLTCTEDEMDECDEDAKILGKLRRRVMKERTMEEIMEAMTDVQAEFTKINRSTAVVEDESTEGAAETEKKPAPVSAQAT
jgi:hypothetical protein